MLLLGDCNDHLKDIRDNSIDLLLTDPPYGIEFMGKDWDKALVPTETWKECYRVLKEGKLAFVMCSPRQDVLSRMIINLQDAGFRTNYSSIYWTYASGFPKAANVSKLLDKKYKKNDDWFEFKYYIRSKLIDGRTQRDFNRLLQSKGLISSKSSMMGHLFGLGEQKVLPTRDIYYAMKKYLNLDDRYDYLIEERPKEWIEAEREIIGYDKYKKGWSSEGSNEGWKAEAHKKYDKRAFTKPAIEEAKKMEGAYVGFQPKPAVEVILVVSKGKTLTWLDDVRIPYQSEDDLEQTKRLGTHCLGFESFGGKKIENIIQPNEKGRFPANLLVSDDVLNDDTIHKSGYRPNLVNKTYQRHAQVYGTFTKPNPGTRGMYPDEGSYSRYFSLDAWAKTFPFLIVPKASKSERNDGLDSIQPVKVNDGRNTPIDNPFQRGETLRTNSHPTVKPLKLMSYLITMGSREGDLVLDPFCGSGTVCIAAHQLHRKWLGIEMNPEYAEIIKKRLADPLAQLKLTSYLENEVPQT